MIHTTIEQCMRYACTHPRFQNAFKLLKNMANEAFVPGKQMHDGDNLYSVSLEYETKPPKDAAIEAHKKYIDVMFIQEGKEKIGYLPMEQIGEISKPYNETSDALLAPICTEMSWICAVPGDVIIFFPEDGHAPGVLCGGKNHVQKIIIKVLIET